MRTEFIVRGTHCKACAALITDVVKDQPGISACEVDFATGKTVITHSAPLDITALQKELTALGEYRIEENSVHILP